VSRRNFQFAERILILILLLSLLWIAAAAIAQIKNPPCAQCAEWNKPQAPFRIFGNSYYVGTHGLSSILITSKAGHILIDGDVPESAKQIVEHIRSLGFRVEDVKIILNSHVHFDHAGGIAELQQLSGARVMASPWSAAVMRQGKVGRGDPQYGITTPIAAIRNVHELQDGETLRIGEIAITAHFTPGHTPGGTSWTWKSCEDSVCHDLVYADSLTAISADGFKFTASHEYPHALQNFEKSFAFLEAAPCDILITVHPEASELWSRLDARQRGTTPDPMVNSGACRQLAEHGREQLRERVAKEKSQQSGSSN
jgi:metallo-beta-lactamase class B